MPQNDEIHSRFVGSHWGRSCLTSRLRTSITVEIVSPGPSRATIEARPERAADRAPAHGRTSLPPRGPVGCCRRGTRRPRRLIGKCRAGAAAGNVSAEGEAIRSNDYRKDTTVKATSTLQSKLSARDRLGLRLRRAQNGPPTGRPRTAERPCPREGPLGAAGAGRAAPDG